MNKEEIVTIIEDVLKKYNLIESEINYEEIENVLKNFGLKYELCGGINVYNIFKILIVDNLIIRVREFKYKECSFDTNKEGCYDFYTLDEFRDYIFNYQMKSDKK